MYGAPALPPAFTHLPYVNPEAPKGGTVIFGETGGFDSLNPYILKGRAPWPMRVHVVESLMARSFDEPFTLYGLLAESVEVPEDRSWVAFTLREAARFSDGTPVTTEDVIWSFETLGTVGHPRYRNAWSGIAAIRATGPRTVRIDLAEPNRELPLILGLRPILKKAQFETVDFASAGNVEVIGSGAYVIDSYEPGRFITFRKNPDWWGRDLSINRGLNNFETIRYEYFRNQDALWESVRTGAISIFADYDVVRWAEQYDFPAMTDGEMQRAEIAYSRPSGMEGFVFNTRREIFADRTVREALALTFDWEWINARVFRDQYARITSYFAGSPLAAAAVAGEGERAVLAPYAASLPEGTLDALWSPPVSDGSGRNRRNLRSAGRMLDTAGWTVVDGIRVNAAGEPFTFEILVNSDRDQTLASLWRETLERLGIEMTVRQVDQAQYQERRSDYDYDMIVNRWAMSLSPGTEQRLYFGAAGRETPGTRNYMGVADPAVDAMIAAMLAAREPEEFTSAVRALDRVLTAGIYVIPFGVAPADRVVWKQGFARPDVDNLYGWWGWWAGPAVWWKEPD
ncbi:MAG: extracellular solute-binding protein [Pseudomonadota bacterium]